jgi:hypothetical protein
MKNVYIVNKGCHDYTDAERFGNLIFLTAGSFNILSTSKMYRKFSEGLKNSQPSDYIMPSGLSIMNAIACSIFSVMHGRLNLLIYYTKNGQGKGAYRERSITFNLEG